MDWADYLRGEAAKYRQLAETAEIIRRFHSIIKSWITLLSALQLTLAITPDRINVNGAERDGNIWFQQNGDLPPRGRQYQK
jgi:hypothetical protein